MSSAGDSGTVSLDSDTSRRNAALCRLRLPSLRSCRVGPPSRRITEPTRRSPLRVPALLLFPLLFRQTCTVRYVVDWLMTARQRVLGGVLAIPLLVVAIRRHVLVELDRVVLTGCIT